MSVEVLGVRVDEITKKDALQLVNGFFVSDKNNLVFTPNPEMIVKAKKDPYFKETINQSRLNLCDGFGLYLASRLQGGKVERITGVDFMLEVCAVAEKQGKRVFLLGSNSDEVVEFTKRRLLEIFPQLLVVGCDKGPEISDESESIKYENGEILNKIDEAKADILFVAFGMGKQEKWLLENIGKMPTVKIAMGVGGAFDYLSGKVIRAPLLMRKFGLEWAYRLYRQPFRAARIINAVLIFSAYIIADFLKVSMKKI